MAISKDRMKRYTDSDFEVKDSNGKWVKMSDYVKSKTSDKSTTSKPTAKPSSKGKKSK